MTRIVLTTLIWAAVSSLALAQTPKDRAKAQAKQAAGSTTNPAAKGRHSKAQAMQVLKTAEEIRSPEKAEAMVDLRTVADGTTSTYEMKILRSTQHRAHIEFLAPATERGRRMLAKGRTYWSKFPDSNRVVPVGKKEMIGNSVFAVADIFQIDPEKDYDPTIVEATTENGVKVLKLLCKAKHKDAPYHRIEYWVEEDGSFPLRAKFYGVSGKHLKSLTIENRKEIAGRMRPEIVRMEDAVIEGRVSWWKTKAMQPANVPDNVFTTDFLKSGR